MKNHVRIKGTKYYLCGASSEHIKTNHLADMCMQCDYIAGGLLGMQNDVREYQKAIRKLKSR